MRAPNCTALPSLCLALTFRACVFCWLFCISQALQKIIVRAQILLRELAGIDYTLEGYTDGCMVEMSNCMDFFDAASCDPSVCAWSPYDAGNPEFGGSCGAMVNDDGVLGDGQFCAGESGRHMETVIDGETSDLVSSLATTVADALDVRGPCFQLGIFLICHFD